MCKAFSMLMDNKNRIYWKAGIDGHEKLFELFKLKEDGKDTEDMKIARIEISPKNSDYLNPNEWILKIDENIRPRWFLYKQEQLCFNEFKIWKRAVYSKINLKEVRKPINPFKIKPHKIDDSVIRLLKEWNSVRDSVWNSVRDSVWNSVGDSVWNSVGDSVWDSVGDSVRDYIGSLFKLKRSEWKYTEKIKTKDYPFESCVKLWKFGLVASFDGKIWRLHGHKKAKILFEISKEELRKRE